jgi:hypothetical protein
MKDKGPWQDVSKNGNIILKWTLGQGERDACDCHKHSTVSYRQMPCNEGAFLE